MQPSKQDVIDNVQDLVCLPEIYLNVRELLEDPASSINDFAEVVSGDIALTAKVLRIANSAFFGFATKIDSIMRAISIMGTGQLHDLVLASSAVDTFKGIPGNIENMEQFWKKSIYCGVVAQLIGSKCNSLDSERFFVIGLLSHIGHLVFCIQLPELARAAIERSKVEAVPLYIIEREMMGFDYAELGSSLLKAWSLPEAFVEPIGCQLNPGKASTFPLESSAIHIANHVSMVKNLGLNPEQQIPPISSIAWQLTELSKDDLGALQTEGDKHFEEAQMLLM